MEEFGREILFRHLELLEHKGLISIMLLFDGCFISLQSKCFPQVLLQHDKVLGRSYSETS